MSGEGNAVNFLSIRSEKYESSVFYYEGSSVKISPDSTVCSNAELTGDITVGPKTVIHPKARIIAQDGPIIIGEGNLIEEKSLIINRDVPGEEPGKPLIIGDYNVFEVWSVCEGKSVGNQNIIEAKARLGPHAKLANGCIIGAKCDVDSQETPPDNSLICGENYLRRQLSEPPQPQIQQLDHLKTMLPNYHYLQMPKRLSDKNS